MSHCFLRLVQTVIEPMAKDGLRTICLAYRDFVPTKAEKNQVSFCLNLFWNRWKHSPTKSRTCEMWHIFRFITTRQRSQTLRRWGRTMWSQTWPASASSALRWSSILARHKLINRWHVIDSGSSEAGGASLDQAMPESRHHRPYGHWGQHQHRQGHCNKVCVLSQFFYYAIFCIF